MEKVTNRVVCETCGNDGRCYTCGMGTRDNHYYVRWILGILIISWIFCIGMKAGELKYALERGGMFYSTFQSPGQMMYGSTRVMSSQPASGNMMFTTSGAGGEVNTVELKKVSQ